ncbi:MAG TPA: DUF4388 domain-containing protein, partial [Polyangia bacterium]
PKNLIVIDPEGRVVVEAGARRRLMQHPGRFRVVPTTGELVILQRVAEDASRRDQSAVGATPGRVALAGEIDGVGGLVDVINFIHGNAWSGQLAAVDAAVRKTIYFRRGDLRTAASNVAEDRLGAILYRYGMITEEALAQAVDASGASVKLGQILVERGQLTPHDLYTYVRKQVEEIFFSVLVLQRGNFYFYRTGDDDGPTSQLQLSTKSLLFDGVRRIDELSYFRTKLPSADVVLVQRHPQPSERLAAREQRVLDLCDGLRDLGRISRACHLGEFETTKILYQLLQSGYVERREEKGTLKLQPSRPGDSVDDMHGRIIDTFNFVFAKIHAAVSSKGKEATLAQGLESFFGSVAEFAPLFVGVSLEPDGTLPREQVRANLQMAPTDNKLDYLHRGLNELLFFELFTAGEAVDRREEIELHQRLNQILREVPGTAGQASPDLTPEITIES